MGLVLGICFEHFYFHVKGYRQTSGLWFQQALMLADTLGLGVFTVVGVKAAFDNGMGN